MRLTTTFAALTCLAIPMLAGAEEPQLRLPSFTGLESKAVQSLDITIGTTPLRFASWFLDGDDPDCAEAKELLRTLTSVHVRSFEFDKDWEYSKSDIEGVRQQLSAPGWSRMARVHDRKADQDVDVYVALDEKKITGLAVIAAEPRQLTIVNIVGDIRPEQLAKLRKPLGLPDTGI